MFQLLLGEQTINLKSENVQMVAKKLGSKTSRRT